MARRDYDLNVPDIGDVAHDGSNRHRRSGRREGGRSPRRNGSATGGGEQSGTVKWFNRPKGYGFIRNDGGGKDVFVHISAVERAGRSTLVEGESIRFVIESDRGGKVCAGNLRFG